MLHGPAKRRQMARSILPSRARKEARARLRLIHRAYRRRVAQRLNADRRRLGTVDVDELFDLGESTRSPDRAVREVVLDRRLADTLNHFERWAVAVTRGFRLEDRLSRLRSWLPEGLIGAHAESHLRFVADISPRGPDACCWWCSPPAASRESERESARLALRRTLERGLHADLNRHLRRAHSERLLHGVHDIDGFVAEVVNCSRYRCTAHCDHATLDALREFIARHEL